MFVATLLIGAAAALWSVYVVTKTGNRWPLMITAALVFLLLFDSASYGAAGSLDRFRQITLLGVHALVLGVTVWIDAILRERVVLQKKHAEELSAAQFENEASRRLKSAFLANMNHEIRTPLTSIIGFSSLLTEEVAGEHRNLMRVIERSGQRLLDTLDSILDLAMLEAGKVRLSRESVNLADEAEVHAERYAPLARRKGLSLEVRAASPDISAYVDRACFGRILTRLISNAVKFTDEGSVIIEVGQSDGRYRVAVRDTGVGIDEEHVPTIFDEFTQSGDAGLKPSEGAGLGLAVTKRLVHLIDGEISVQTERHKGSTFVLFLPPGRSRQPVAA